MDQLALIDEPVKVSVVVISYNGLKFLKNCLDSVLDQTTKHPYEVILADNRSVDGSADFVREAYPCVKVIQFDKNYGYYEAFNMVATRFATGEYLIPLPQDTIVHRRWLDELIKVADCDPDIKICLVNSINPPYPDYPNKERDQWVDGVYLMGTTVFGSTYSASWHFNQDIVPVITYSGVSALIKKDILEISDHLFDSTLSHYAGDAELGIRMNALGKKIVLVPIAIVYHIEDDKDWFDWRLLVRFFQGARDTIVIYFQNMFGVEFLLYFPLILIGLPLKVFSLRTGLLQKFVLAGIAASLVPVVAVAAIVRLPRYNAKRKAILAKRTSKFGLLRLILSRERK